MHYYKLTWQLLSPLDTPLMADTIFGHFCWAIKYRHGDGKLEQFLNAYNTSPPLLVSDGFPAGHLPVPRLPLSDPPNQLKDALTYKKAAKLRFIPVDLIERQGKLSGAGLFSVLSDIIKLNEKPSEKQQSCVREIQAHNTIDRLTNTSLQTGGFYHQETMFFPKETCFDVYAAIDPSVCPMPIEELCRYIEKTGYGKNKSTGRGQFKITVHNHERFMPKPTDNAFMALSSFCPAEHDPTDGFYDITTKFGKLGGDYAVSGSPFKKPLIMLTAGSLFFTGSIRPHYGRLVSGVHPDSDNPIFKKIKQYGYTMSYPLQIDKEATACVR